MARCQDEGEDSAYEIVEHLPSQIYDLRLRSASFSSEEYELHAAICFQTIQRYNHDSLTWTIPDSDSSDLELTAREDDQPADSKPVVTALRRAKGLKVQLPSDSEDEEIYDLVKSPRCSIQSAEPPLPPPLSSIPSRAQLLPKSGKPAGNIRIMYAHFVFLIMNLINCEYFRSFRSQETAYWSKY